MHITAKIRLLYPVSPKRAAVKNGKYKECTSWRDNPGKIVGFCFEK
jgi:hypothetical protein